MRLTPTDRDRLLIFTAAELARARRARGLKLNVPEATALIADTVCEAARDGLRLMEAAARGASVLGADDVLPGVPDIVREVIKERGYKTIGFVLPETMPHKLVNGIVEGFDGLKVIDITEQIDRLIAAFDAVLSELFA